MPKPLPIIVAFVLLVLPALAIAEDAASKGGFDHSHSLLDALLGEYVSEGLVDYRGLKGSEKLHLYLERLAEVSPEEYATWSADERLAFWINAYNAFTIKAVVDHYPIEGSFLSPYPENSIRQIDGVWDELKFQAAGREVTLDEIEHGILRKEFREPRIHFALVCASLGCAPLKGEAYRASLVREQLDKSARAFVNDPRKVRIKPRENEVALSKIFKWFGGDFIDRYGDAEHFKRNNPRERAVLNFIREHSNDGALEGFSRTRRVKITYLPYDWSLNEQRSLGD